MGEHQFPSDPSALISLVDEVRNINPEENWGLVLPDDAFSGNFVNKDDFYQADKRIGAYNFRVFVVRQSNPWMKYLPDLSYKHNYSSLDHGVNESGGMFFVSGLKFFSRDSRMVTFSQFERPDDDTSINILRHFSDDSGHVEICEMDYLAPAERQMTRLMIRDLTPDDMEWMMIGARRFKIGLERVLQNPMYIEPDAVIYEDIGL